MAAQNLAGTSLQPVSLATTILRWVVRITGLLQLLLGIALWTGNLLPYLHLHILDGYIFTLAFLAAVVLAAVARVGLWRVLVGIVWVLAVPALGIMQTRILPGDFHWIVQVVHLLLGAGAIGFADRLAGASLARRSSP